MTPVQIWNDLWPIILCNLKTKHLRCIKLYIFGILMTRQTVWRYFQRNPSMFQFLTHVELSRSMVAILEMPQYVAYQKNVVYALLNSVQSLTVLTFCAQLMGLAALLQTVCFKIIKFFKIVDNSEIVLKTCSILGTVVWNDYLLIIWPNVIFHYTRSWKPTANNQICWITKVSTHSKTLIQFCWKLFTLKTFIGDF